MGFSWLVSKIRLIIKSLVAVGEKREESHVKFSPGWIWWKPESTVNDSSFMSFSSLYRHFLPQVVTFLKTLGGSPAYLIRTGGFVHKVEALVSATSVLTQESQLHQRLCVCAEALSRVWLFATPWTIDCQAPLSVGFSRQAYWRGLPFATTGDLPHPGIKPTSPVSPALADRFFNT